MTAVEREGCTMTLSWQDFEIFRAFSFKNTFQQLYLAKIRIYIYAYTYMLFTYYIYITLKATGFIAWYKYPKKYIKIH